MSHLYVFLKLIKFSSKCPSEAGINQLNIGTSTYVELLNFKYLHRHHLHTRRMFDHFEHTVVLNIPLTQSFL